MNTINKTTVSQPWGLTFIRAALVMGVGLLLFLAGNAYLLTTKRLMGLGLLLAGVLAIRFWQLSKESGASDVWLLVNGLVDGLIGLGLLLYPTQPLPAIVFFFSFWGVLLGVLGAVETIFIFLGLQDASRAATDFSLVLLNAVGMLVGGGLAFLLLMQPLGVGSIHYAGLLVVALGILLALESRNLKRDAQPPA